MKVPSDHYARVEEWIELCLQRQPRLGAVQVFEQAFGCVYDCAYLILGEITVHAAMDRVVYIAGRRCEWLSQLEFHEANTFLSANQSVWAKVDDNQLATGVSTLFGELFVVLGRLTGEVLSDSFYQCLEEAVQEGRAVTKVTVEQSTDKKHEKS